MSVILTFFIDILIVFIDRNWVIHSWELNTAIDLNNSKCQRVVKS